MSGGMPLIGFDDAAPITLGFFEMAVPMPRLDIDHLTAAQPGETYDQWLTRLRRLIAEGLAS